MNARSPSKSSIRFSALSSVGAFVALLVSLAPSAGCTTDAYCFDCQPGSIAGSAGSTGGSSGTSGTAGVSGTAGNAGSINTGGSGGQLDAGSDACTADTTSDPSNCGECGHVCELFGAFPKCEASACKIDHCAPGFVDLNGINDDGCEKVCTPTNNGVEICDNLDNDCNGIVDDNFDFANDAQNCGTCGNVCSLLNATAKCSPDPVVKGVCVIDTCTPGFTNSDGLDNNGCEYTCPVFPTTAEICNELDDDCDGVINNDNPGGGATCESTCPGGVCQGICTPGTTVCTGTSLICVPGVTPQLETCNELDDDCDGVVDNGFDLANDPLNCLSCGNACALSNAVAKCSPTGCAIASCLPGFKSLDGDDSNGCEYTCPVSPPTVEVCDGLDNDCNGVIDDAVTVAAQKPSAALCYPTAGTPCAGADFVCTGTTGWRCNYGAGVEVDANGKLVVVESLCDGIDGNCNGQIDEAFADVGTDCDNGLLGACRDLGKRKCDPLDKTATVCDLTVLPDPIPGAPTAESCNGVDDDCNGTVDDGIVDDMVSVVNGGTTFLIDRYEASRPDATDTDVGLSEARRCVVPNRLPWTLTTQAEAAAACAATGARLCTAAEMTFACATAAANKYPYAATTYAPLTCNGLDYDGVPGGTNDNVLLPTGSADLAGCVTSNGIHDLSGNAAEWTSTITGNTGAPLNLSIYQVKGGSFQTPAAGLTCQFSLSRYASNAILDDIGFRCCK